MTAANLKSLVLRILRCLSTARSKFGLNVEKFLGKEDTWASLNGLEKCEMFTRQGVVPRPRATPGWSGSKDEQNKIFQYIYQKHSS